MTPKEKAKAMIPKHKADDIFKKMLHEIYKLDYYPWLDIAKLCSLVVVDEILNAEKDVDEFCDSYWQEVKQEIEKL